MAVLAYHLHWPLDQILELEHHDRRRWVRHVSDLNQQRNPDH